MARISQHLNHRDPTHADDALLRLNNLRSEGILCDLTIIVEGKEYKAHKAVMAACSDYFLNAICGGKTTATVTSEDQGCVTVNLDHVTVRGFVPLLEYAYTANLYVNSSDVIDVLSAASYMQMFKVASACSEFMRSNIMWSQSIPRLVKLPGINHNLLEESKSPSRGSLSPAFPSTSTIPHVMPNLIKANGEVPASGSLGQPPVLIPIHHPMNYDVGLQHLAASMGTQNFLSRASGIMMNASRSTPPLSPPSSRNSSQSPNFPWHTNESSRPAESNAGTPSKNSDAEAKFSPDDKSDVKPFKVKIESIGENEDSRSSPNGSDKTNDLIKPSSPNGSTCSEPVEDSWQALQKLYSIKMNEAQSLKQQGVNGGRQSSPLSTMSPDSKDLQNHNGLHKNGPSIKMHMSNGDNFNNNNNNSVINYGGPDKAHELADFKMGTNNSGSSPPQNIGLTAAALKDMMHKSMVPHQEKMLMSQNGTDLSKLIDLPMMPANGQYMSVRRRTLQSTVPKPHQCQICGSRFTRFHNLKQHIKLHSGIKPYECDECGKRFTRNYTLRLHKMKHVGIRNFRCGTCDASFTSLGEFRAHLRITMHSHLSGTNPLDYGSQIASSEPEDLSSRISPESRLSSASTKRSRYDATLLNFQRSMLAREGSGLIPSGLGMMNLRDNNSMGETSSGGGGSPQLSERSMSPQDLSAKPQVRKSPVPEEKNPSNYSPQSNRDENHVMSNEEDCRNGSRTNMDDGEMVNHSTNGSSPANSRVNSPNFDAEMEINEKETTANGMDQDTDQDYNMSSGENEKKASNKNDLPISLAVNASA